MSKILYEVYQNDIKDSESVMYGKWYARDHEHDKACQAHL